MACWQINEDWEPNPQFCCRSLKVTRDVCILHIHYFLSAERLMYCWYILTHKNPFTGMSVKCLIQSAPSLQKVSSVLLQELREWRPQQATVAGENLLTGENLEQDQADTGVGPSWQWPTWKRRDQTHTAIMFMWTGCYKALWTVGVKEKPKDHSKPGADLKDPWYLL